jgi:hypothetical protein
MIMRPRRKAGKLLEDYLCHVFFILQESDDARHRMENLILTSGTFQHIATFLPNHRSVTRGLRFPPEAKDDADHGVKR